VLGGHVLLDVGDVLVGSWMPDYRWLFGSLAVAVIGIWLGDPVT
jgi:hypothetical protein